MNVAGKWRSGSLRQSSFLLSWCPVALSPWLPGQWHHCLTDAAIMTRYSNQRKVFKSFFMFKSQRSPKDSKNYPLNKLLVQSLLCVTNFYPLLGLNQYIRSLKKKKTTDGFGNIFLKLTLYEKFQFFTKCPTLTRSIPIKQPTQKINIMGKKEQANLKIPIKI